METRSPAATNCELCNEQLRTHEKPRTDEPALCDRCLRANQSTIIAAYDVDSEVA